MIERLGGKTKKVEDRHERFVFDLKIQKRVREKGLKIGYKLEGCWDSSESLTATIMGSHKISMALLFFFALLFIAFTVSAADIRK